MTENVAGWIGSRTNLANFMSYDYDHVIIHEDIVPYVHGVCLPGFYAFSFCFLNKTSGTLKTAWMIGLMNS